MQGAAHAWHQLWFSATPGGPQSFAGVGVPGAKRQQVLRRCSHPAPAPALAPGAGPLTAEAVRGSVLGSFQSWHDPIGPSNGESSRPPCRSLEPPRLGGSRLWRLARGVIWQSCFQRTDYDNPTAALEFGSLDSSALEALERPAEAPQPAALIQQTLQRQGADQQSSSSRSTASTGL